MRASKLVEQLQKIVELHGDLNVMYTYDCNCARGNLDGFIFDPSEPCILGGDSEDLASCTRRKKQED
jgi:hypothetical protein